MTGHLAPLREVRLSGRVSVFSPGGDTPATSYGTNATVVFGDGAVLVVDPFIAPAYARRLAELVEARAAGPVTWVVSTHHHTDHVLGASVFTAHGAAFAAHEAAAARMAVEHATLIGARRSDPALAFLFADAEPVAPSLLVREGSECSLDVGGVRVALRPAGPAHTPGDLLVLLPNLGIVATGDVVFHGYHANLEDGDVAGWKRALTGLLASGAETFVPGHGAPGGREVVDAQVGWFETVEALVGAAIRGGRDRRLPRPCFAPAFPATSSTPLSRSPSRSWLPHPDATGGAAHPEPAGSRLRIWPTPARAGRGVR